MSQNLPSITSDSEDEEAFVFLSKQEVENLDAEEMVLERTEQFLRDFTHDSERDLRHSIELLGQIVDEGDDDYAEVLADVESTQRRIGKWLRIRQTLLNCATADNTGVRFSISVTTSVITMDVNMCRLAVAVIARHSE